MPRSAPSRKLPVESATQTAWLERARKLSVKERLPLIERALRKLPKTPTAKNVYWRKTLLRLHDASRLEFGTVSAADLQQENSPFAAIDFRTARISFRPRVRA
jgi:hypothetical protein